MKSDQVVSAEATPKPFKIQGRVERCVIENLPVIARDGALPECYVGGDVNFVLEAMNSLGTLKERVAELEKALDRLYKLIENGDLVRDIANDDEFSSFASQGIRITAAVRAAGVALAKVEGKVNAKHNQT